MAMFEVYKLVPRGAFHFGVQGIGLEATAESCPSDTLYSALYVESLLTGPPILQPTADGDIVAPLFRLSSCLPYAGTALLFPLPRLRPVQLDMPQAGRRKLFKKLRYVSVTVLRHVLAGGALHDYLPDDASSGKGKLYQGGAALIATQDASGILSEKLWEKERLDHVTVDRERESGQYYAVGQVRFAPGCGLCILAQTRDQAAGRQLLTLLSRLGHSGLGGRRSPGLGQFDVASPQQVELPDVTDCERVMLLSRYLPTPKELEDGVLGPQSAYDLVQVAGWLTSNYPGAVARRRKSIHMLAEGSVVQCVDNRPPLGKAADLAPDLVPFAHPVWRFGMALTIGVTAEDRA